jgi:CheY-like chemotaxis protein
MTGPPHAVAPADPAGAPLTNADLADIRHELRTPLNHILGYSELLLEDTGTEELSALVPDLEKLRTAGKELLRQVNDHLGAERQHIDGATLRALGLELFPRVGQFTVDVVQTLLRAQPLGVSASTRDLERIATAAGQLLTLIDRRLLTTSSGQEPANQGETPHPAPGTLAAAPRRLPPERAAATEPVRPQRVLVVDDNETNRDVLCRRLERLGHATATAENGRRALEMIGTGSFDLVLLDIMMPEVDGYQVLEQVKADPARRDLPIIMISAVDEIQSVVRCIERGAEDYLAKPFDPVLLRARLGACLEKKRLRDLELDYLRNVATLTTAAAAVQAEAFDPDCLAEVAGRNDELGQLARVFQHMAREVHAREQRLKQQVQQLRVEVDEARKAKQVAEITETGYFQALQQKAQELRRRMGKEEGGR